MPDEVKAILMLENPDQRLLIEDLYANGLFGERVYHKPDEYNSHELLYDTIWKDWNGIRNPKETRRFITLACALEPLSEKTGCTTRTTDLNRDQKLEYFISGAINIGDAFEQLSQRVLEAGKQPGLIYDLAHKAQMDCKKNRSGGRVNQGIIEMLVSIVTSQMLFDQKYSSGVYKVLEGAKSIMQNTSKEDVKELIKMKRLAYDLSGYHDREVPVYPHADTVYEYYMRDMMNSKKPTSIKHNEEFVKGFPAVQCIYESIMNSEEYGFNRKVEEAYAQVRKKYHSGVSPGLTADCTACGIYLVLSQHPKDKVIW